MNGVQALLYRTWKIRSGEKYKLSGESNSRCIHVLCRVWDCRIDKPETRFVLYLSRTRLRSTFQAYKIDNENFDKTSFGRKSFPILIPYLRCCAPQEVDLDPAQH